MDALNYEFLYEAHFDLVERQVIQTADGTRVVVRVGGGWIKSPKFTVTEIMQGAADWLRVRSDGVSEIDVRAVFKLDDEALCYVTYTGLNIVPDDIRKRIGQGEDVDPSEYYFRVTPRFQTGSEIYGWLNNIICVANGKIGAGGGFVEYKGFQIL